MNDITSANQAFRYIFRRANTYIENLNEEEEEQSNSVPNLFIPEEDNFESLDQRRKLFNHLKSFSSIYTFNRNQCQTETLSLVKSSKTSGEGRTSRNRGIGGSNALSSENKISESSERTFGSRSRKIKRNNRR